MSEETKQWLTLLTLNILLLTAILLEDYVEDVEKTINTAEDTNKSEVKKTGTTPTSRRMDTPVPAGSSG